MNGIVQLNGSRPPLRSSIPGVDEPDGVAGGGQAGDRDRAAVPGGEVRPFPHVTEQDVIGVTDPGGREITEHALRTGRFRAGHQQSLQHSG